MEGDMHGLAGGSTGIVISRGYRHSMAGGSTGIVVLVGILTQPGRREYRNSTVCGDTGTSWPVGVQA
jgi:hypothetical protein